MSNFYDDFEAYLNGENSSITEQIITNAKGNSVERMGIYRDAYSLRLIDILYGDFPTIYEILGTDTFLEIAKDYLVKYPSNSFTVRYFGQHLAKYLHEEKPYADFPYLWQIADFEWSKGTVFDAPDTPLFTLEDLASIPPQAWEKVTFTFVPAMTHLVYDYNVPQIWQAVENDTQDNEPVMLDNPMPWVMWRKNLNPHWYSMDADENWFFMQARQGMNFTELCNGLSQWITDEEKIPVRAAEIVRRWINEIMLVRINS
ncbi:MAG: HvfC/BufC family peptide modification chaperone [Ostreibacterium sp.]